PWCGCGNVGHHPLLRVQRPRRTASTLAPIRLTANATIASVRSLDSKTEQGSGDCRAVHGSYVRNCIVSTLVSPSPVMTESDNTPKIAPVTTPMVPEGVIKDLGQLFKLLADETRL